MEEATEYNFNYLVNRLKKKYDDVDIVVNAINHTVRKSDGKPLSWEQKCLLLYTAFKEDEENETI